MRVSRICRRAVLALLLVLPAKTDDLSDDRVVASHQVCCLQSSSNASTTFSGILVKDWADILTGMVNNRPSVDDRCLHVFTVGNVVHDEEENDQLLFQHRVPTYRPTGQKREDARCASISLFALPTTEPLKSSVDFFTPELLDEISRRQPSVQIELGSAKFVMDGGSLEVESYFRRESKTYLYKDAYGKGESTFAVATEDQMREIVTRDICDTFDNPSQCKDVVYFLESVTDTRIPDSCELMKEMLTKDEMRKYLTVGMLQRVELQKELERLRMEIAGPRSDTEEEITAMLPQHSDWITFVPRDAVDRLRPSGPLPRAITTSKAATKMKVKLSSIKRSSIRKKHESRDDDGASRVNMDKVLDLSMANDDDLIKLITKAKELGLKHRTRMSSAFASTQIARTFPLTRRWRTREDGDRSRRKSRKTGGVPAHQITDFLLVYSLLAVSKTKYSNFIASGAIHKLQRTRMPIFSVCADKITWEPKQPPSGSSSGDWLSCNYRFTLAGSRHASFEYGTLSEVNNEEGLSDSSQCAILALVGVAEEGFKDLTRQPFDMIFGVFTRESIRMTQRTRVDDSDDAAEMPKEWSNYELLKETKDLKSVSTASDVDLWRLPHMVDLPGGDNLQIGPLFNRLARFFREHDTPPEWQKGRQSSPLHKRKSLKSSRSRQQQRP